MNSVSAKNLLQLLQKNIVLSKPIKPQLFELFVIAPWSQTVVLRTSWQGRIAAFLQSSDQQTSQQNKIEKIFKEALDKSDISQEDFLLGIKLRHAIGFTGQKTSEEPDDAEIDRLNEKRKSNQKKAEEKKAAEVNILVDYIQKSKDIPPHSIEMFKYIFDGDLGNPQKTLDYIEKYLVRNPSQGLSNWRENLENLRESFRRQAEMNTSFPNPETKDKPTLLKQAAKEFALVTQCLLENRKAVFQFGFGSKHISFTSILQVLKQLPSSAIDSLPNQVKAIVYISHLHDPKQFAEWLVCNSFEYLPLNGLDVDRTKLGVLFNNEERALPEAVAGLLPKIVELYFEQTLKKGVVGNASSLINDSSLKDALQWLSAHGHEYLQKDKTLRIIIEDKLIDLLSGELNSLGTSSFGKIFDLLKSSRHLLSPQLMELLGLDELLVSGPLWIEVENAGASFNVAIYGLGNAIDYHPVDPKTGERYAVLRIKDIPKEKLSEDFFYSMLYRHYAPFWSPEASCKASDIYMGPLACLEGNVAPNQAEDPKGVHNLPPSAWHLSALMLMKSSFEMRWEAILAFCKARIVDGQVVITDPSDKELMDKALNELESDLSLLKKSDSKKAGQVQQLLEEIKKALAGNPRTTTQKTVQEVEQTGVSPLGLTLPELTEYQGVIKMALGDEVGEALEKLTSKYKPVKNTQTRRPPLNFQIPSFEPTIHSYYLNAYYQIAANALSTAMALAGFFYTNLTQILYSTALSTAFHALIPNTIFDWYIRVTDAIKSRIKELCLVAMIKLFTSTETREKLKSNMLLWIKRAQDILEGQQISYRLDPALQETHKNSQKDSTVAKESSTVPAFYEPFLFDRKEFDESIFEPQGALHWMPHTTDPTPLPERYKKKLVPPSLNELREWLQLSYQMQPANKHAQLNTDNLHLDKIKGVVGDEEYTLKLKQRELQREKRRLCKSKEQDYLLAKISTLPMPSHDQNSLWHRIERPDLYIEALATLFLQITIDDGYHDEAEVLAAGYKVLAIMDCLIRKCPEAKMEGININAYPILQWMKMDTKLMDPLVLQELYDIAKYLLPAIDLDNPPSAKEIEAMAEKCLFHYKFSENESYLSVITMELGFSGFTKAELDHCHQFTAASNLGPRPKLLIDDIKTGNKIRYPKVFKLLRLQTIICNYLVNRRSFQKFIPVYLGFDFRKKNFIINNQSLPMIECGMTKCKYDDEDVKPDLQSRIRISVLENINDKFYLQSCMSRAKSSERIPLNLNYIKGNIKEFSERPFVANIISDTLFRYPGELKRQIKHSPQVVKVLEEIFNELIDLSISSKRISLSLDYIRLAFDTKIYCEHFLRKPGAFMPDLMAKFDQVFGLANDRDLDYFDKFKLEMIFTQGNFANLPRNVKKDAIVILFEWMMQQIPNPVFVKIFWVWKPEIDLLMDDKDTREEILQALLPKIAYDTDKLFSPDARWQRMGCLFFQKGNVKLSIPYGQSTGLKRKRIDVERVKNHPLIKPLLIDNEGFNVAPLNSYYYHCNYGFTLIRHDDKDQIEVKVSKNENHIPFLMTNIKSYYKANEKGMLCTNAKQIVTIQIDIGDNSKIRNQKQRETVIAEYLSKINLFNPFQHKLEAVDPLSHIGKTDSTLVQRFFVKGSNYMVYLYYYREGFFEICVLEHSKETIKFIRDRHHFWIQLKVPEQLPIKQVEGTNANQITSNEILQRLLGGLSRFIPIENVKAYTKKGCNHITEFNLGKLLNFKVKENEEGKLQAESHEYPGYILSINQSHPAMHGIASYLLLENQKGKQVALIPGFQWLQAWASRYTETTGMFSRAALDAVAKSSLWFNDYQSLKCYTFEIDGVSKDNPQGILTSSDPEALVYLMALYYFEGRHEAFEQTLKQLEWSCQLSGTRNDIWTQTLPLLFFPAASDKISHLKRRVIAAIAQNQCVVEPLQDVRELDITDLIIGLAILKELSDMQEDNNPRQKLPPYQEYFMYETAFEKLGGFIKSRLFGLSQKIDIEEKPANQFSFSALKTFVKSKVKSNVAPSLEAVGFETLLETSGLSKKLSKRYAALKATFGLQSSRAAWALRAYNYASEFNQVNSSIPEVLIHPKSSDASISLERAYESTFACLSRVLTGCRIHWMYNLDADTLKSLFWSMNQQVRYPFPTQNTMKFSASGIKTDFVSYYAVAKGYFIPDQSKKLSCFLKYIKGFGDIETRILVNYLEAVVESPADFPPVSELVDSFYKQEGTYTYKLKFQLEHYKTYPKFYEFFDKLNRIAIGRLVSKNVVDPYYRDFLLRNGVYAAISAGASHILPHGTTGLVQVGLDVASSAAIGEAYDRGLRAMQPLKQLMPSTASTVSNAVAMESDDWRRSPNVAYQTLKGAINAVNPFSKTKQEEKVEKEKPLLKTAKAALHVIAPFSLLYLSRFAFASFQAGPQKKEEEQTYLSYLAYQGLTMVGGAFVRIALAKMLKTQLTLTQLTGPYMSSTLHKASRAINVAKKAAGDFFSFHDLLSTLGETELQAATLHQIDCTPFEAQENAINEFLKDQFDLVFTAHPPKPKKARMIDPPKGCSKLVAHSYQKVNDSLKAYAEAPDPDTFSVHKENALLKVYVNLLKIKNDLSSQAEKEFNSLLGLFNTQVDPSKQKPTPITLLQIHQLLDKGDLGEIGAQVGLTNDELPAIELKAMLLDYKLARLSQIERLLSILENLPPDRFSAEYAEQLQLLALGLKTVTVFDFKNTPIRLMRLFLRFQAGSKTMLWKQQVNNSKQALVDNVGSVVTHALPGTGKTFNLIPTEAAHQSDGSHLAVTIFPRQLAGDNFREVYNQLLDIFGKRSHLLQSRREMLLNIRRLEGILVLAIGSIRERLPLQMTKEDAQSFQSIFFDRMHRYRNVKGANTDEEKQCLILLKKILGIFLEMGVAIADETHVTLSFKKQLNYPIGSALKIPTSLWIAGEVCLRAIIRDKTLKPLIRGNKLHAIDPDHYHREIKPRIVRKLGRQDRFKASQDRLTEFVDYVCEKSDHVPAWIKEDKELHREIAFVRGILNTLLPMNFSKRAQVNFDISKKGNGSFARPSDGNSHVLESDSIRLPYETFVKTFLLLQAVNLSQVQGRQLLQKLEDNAKRMMQNDSIPYENTLLFKTFGKFFPTIESITSQGLEQFCMDSEAILLYMRHFVRKEILYWKHNIQNTSLNFVGIYGRTLSCTGTPNNSPTYHANLKVIEDPVTLGEAIDILERKCKGIHLTEDGTPEKIVSNILEGFFKPGSPHSALIDGGAQATGMENVDVAKIMADFCRKQRLDIKGIKHYHEDRNGKEEATTILIGRQDGEPEPEHLLTYFDQRHGFGANIKQTGHGVLLLGPNHFLDELIQQMMRIRGLSKEQMIKAIEDFLVSLPMQYFDLVMTHEVQKLILPGKPGQVPTMMDILHYAIKSSAGAAEEENYPSMLEKYNDSVRQAAYNKIHRMPDEDFNGWMKIYDEFEKEFVSELNDCPIALFGGFSDKESAEDACDRAADYAISKIEKSRTFNKFEKKHFEETVKSMPRPPMQEEVEIWHVESASKIAIGLQQTVEQTATQQQENDNSKETENEQDQSAQLQTHSQNQWRGKLRPYNEQDWTKDAKLDTLDWLKFTNPHKPDKYKCSFYTVQSLLSAAELTCISSVSSMFDKRLWMSNNFVQRIGGISNAAADIGSADQMELYNVLIHLKKDNGKLQILALAPLTVREEIQWQAKLAASQTQEGELKTVLWNAGANYVIAGYKINKDSFKQNPDLQMLIGQLKFLNGDVNYPELKEAMSSWITKHDPAKLQAAFEDIHRKRNNISMVCKDIDHIFMDARIDEVPIEEKL